MILKVHREVVKIQLSFEQIHIVVARVALNESEDKITADPLY